MFVIISVIYRPIEQLLSRTIAERRARGQRRSTALRVPMLIQAGFALVFLVVALALHEDADRQRLRRQRGALRRARRRHARLRRELLRARLARRPRALRAVRRARADGVAVARLLRAAPSRSASPNGQTAVALGIAAAPLVSLVVVPLRSRARTPARGRRREPARRASRGGAAPITADEADAALAGPGTEGVQEAAAHET